MAVNYTLKSKPELIENLDMLSGLGAMFDSGVQLSDVHTKNGVTFSWLAEPSGLLVADPKNQWFIPIKSGVITMAQTFELGIASRKLIGSKIDKALEGLKEDKSNCSWEEAAEEEEFGVVEDGDELHVKPKTIGDLLEDAQEAEAKVYKKATGIENKNKKKWKDSIKFESTPGKKLEENMKGVKVALRNATKLYQPVGGSGSSSTYYAIALSDGINIGCRIRPGGNISIRAEGPLVNDFEYKLAHAGMNKISNLHASVHLKNVKKEFLAKFVGAILYATNIQYKKVATDMTPIIGKGN